MKMFQLSSSKISVELTAYPCYSAEISSRPVRRHNPPKRNRNGKLEQFFSLLGCSESNDGWGNCQSFPFPLQTNFFPAKELRPPKKEGGEKKMSLFSPVSLKRGREKKRKSLWSRFSFPNPFFCFFFGIWFQGGGGWSAVDRWQFTRQWLETGPGSLFLLLRASWWRVRASKFKPQLQNIRMRPFSRIAFFHASFLLKKNRNKAQTMAKKMYCRMSLQKFPLFLLFRGKRR